MIKLSNILFLALALTINNMQICSSLDSSGNCVTCIPGYILNVGRCIKTTTDPNCVYFVNSVCLVCKSGYYTKNGACQQGKVSSCAVYKPDTGLCSAC